jgi:Porin subfamily
MKMVKSLLLGSAAGLVAVSAGQAADLPVKAKPVEYVKVCSLYGAGFYYMPGTDMCIKIGGWVRVEATWGNNNGSMTWGPWSGQENIRNTSNFVTRERGYLTADAREQTAYGTARAYIDVGLSDNSIGESGGGQGTFSSNRAFLQWAGITAGLTQSFYDFYSAAASAYRAAFMPIEDTGDGGQWVAAYTAQLGNGLSATVSAENRRDTQIIGVNGPANILTVGTVTSVAISAGAIIDGASFGAGLNSQLGYGGYQMPDIVGNLRVDQTWGSAQVMGALHQLNPLYYNDTVTSGNGLGHPGDSWGWVVGAGLRLNFPMVSQGDYFQGEVNYTQGALRYLNQPTQGNYEAEQSNSAAYGIMSDCVYGSAAGLPIGGVTTSGTAANGSSCQLTTAWSVNAAYEHYWTPSVHESFVGAYEAVSYNNQANGALCWSEGVTSATGANNQAAIVGGGLAALPGCNNNWSVWGVSSRLQWDVTKSFYLGLEVMYNHLNSATSATGTVPGSTTTGFYPAAFPAPGPGGPGAVGVGGNNVENAWNVTVRMHKDFLP